MALNPVKTFNQQFSCKGAIALPIDIDLTSVDTLDLDLGYLVQQNLIDFLSGVYVNLLDEDEDLTFYNNISRQSFTAFRGTVGFYPFMLPDTPVVTITSTGNLNAINTLILYNIPFVPFIWPPSAGAVEANVHIGDGDDVAEGSITDDPYTDVTGAADGTVIGLLKGLFVSGFAWVVAQGAALAGVKGGLIQGASSTNAPAYVNAKVNPFSLDLDGHLRIKQKSPTLTGGVLALTGASQTLVAAGAGMEKVIFQNPIGNAPVTLDFAGAAVVAGAGFVQQAGGSIILEPGALNGITIIGTAGQSVIIFKG